MKITLNKYDDLGKCSMATLLNEFDTERDKIFFMYGGLDNKFEVKINNIDDLLMWIWNIPAIYCRFDEGNVWVFSKCEPWWHSEYYPIAHKYEKDSDNYRYWSERIDSRDKEMFEMCENLRKENGFI